MMDVPDPFWLTTAPEALCRTHATERAIAAVIPELEDSEPTTGRLAAAGWKRSLFCEARCLTDVRVEDWSPTPIALPSEPDRTDPDHALALLDQAIAARDLETLGVLTAGVLLASPYRELDAADPDALWVSLQTARASDQWGDTAGWIPIHGQWILAFTAPSR
jgi:hypothetical protein